MAQLEKMACRVAFLSQNPVVGNMAKLDVIVCKSVFLNICCDTGCYQVQPPVVGIWQSWNSDLQASTLG